MYKILGSVNEPKDIKKLNINELEDLAKDIRTAILNKVSKTGGHFGPNLGVVEATIALHYVFDSPHDKLVFDVSHQSYPHKILTGRKDYFIKDELLTKVSGFSSPKESIHDIFSTGHTSTSISQALGLAKARDLKNDSYKVLAFIGDGALSGGQALESLNIAGDYEGPLLIIVNDNEISIAENHGGIYKSLRDLRKSHGSSSNNIFKAFGLDYVYEENGNDISSMIKALKDLKDIKKPTVLHIHTLKGKGYALAEKDGETWHSREAFDLKTGKDLKEKSTDLTYKDFTRTYIMEKAKADKDFMVLSPAMPRSVGLDKKDREILGDQYLDTGIAEEACISMAAGLGKNGAKPLVVTNATFMQRAYDQVSQDLSLNEAPATILLIKSGFESAKDMTHLGIFTISIFSNVPNLVLLCPTSIKEYKNMLDWSLDQKDHPVMILIPGNEVTERDADKDFSEINKFKLEEKGEKVAIIGLGDYFQKGEALAQYIEEKLGFKPSLINPRFASGVDKNLLEDLKKDHDLVITMENGILDGGFGQKISSFYAPSTMKVLSYGLEKTFYDRYKPEEVLYDLGFTNEQILEEIKKLLA
jgi:1-deoxy-D-xylulose-5-phosphate synthase